MYDEMTEALVKIARGYYIILDAYLKLREIEIHGNKESLFYNRRPCSPSSIAKKRHISDGDPFSRNLTDFELRVVKTICSIEHYARDAKNGNPSGLRLIIENDVGIVMKCHSFLDHIKEVQQNG